MTVKERIEVIGGPHDGDFILGPTFADNVQLKHGLHMAVYELDVPAQRYRFKHIIEGGKK